MGLPSRASGFVPSAGGLGKIGASPVYAGGVIQTSRTGCASGTPSDNTGVTAACSLLPASGQAIDMATTASRAAANRIAIGSRAATPGLGTPALMSWVDRTTRRRCSCQRASASEAPTPSARLSSRVWSGRCSSRLTLSSLRRPAWASGMAMRRMPFHDRNANPPRNAARTTACSHPGSSGRTPKSANARNSTTTENCGPEAAPDLFPDHARAGQQEFAAVTDRPSLLASVLSRKTGHRTSSLSALRRAVPPMPANVGRRSRACSAAGS